MSANNSPTTFTDDYLKKLKEYINNDNFAYVDGCPDFLRSHGIVARLEAAEVVAQHIEDRQYKKGPEQIDVEAWRKSCGK